MESQPNVHAWGLLARLVCVREVFREEAADPSGGSPSGYMLTPQMPQSSVPRDDMALIQGLYGVGAQEERRAWIRRAFQNSIESEKGEERTLGEDRNLLSKRGERLQPINSGWSRPGVSTYQMMEEATSGAAMRPGRLMDSIRNLLKELKAKGEDGASAQHRQECQLIYKDCLRVLHEIGSEKE